MTTEGTRGEVPEQAVFAGIVDELCTELRVCGLAAHVLRRADDQAVLIANPRRGSGIEAGELGADGLEAALEARVVLEWEPDEGELLVDGWYDLLESRLEELEPLAVAGIADDLYRYVLYYVLDGEEDGDLEVFAGVRRAEEGLETSSLAARRGAVLEVEQLREASQRRVCLRRLAADVSLMVRTVSDWLEQVWEGVSG